MKTNKIIWCIFALAGQISLMPRPATAICTTTSCSSGGTFTQKNTISNCLSTQLTETCYFGGHKVVSCPTCGNGYTRKQTTLSLPCGSVSYYACEKDGPTCVMPPCNSSDWATYVSNVERRIIKHADFEACKCTSSTEYRCSAGTYQSGDILCHTMTDLEGNTKTVCNGCYDCPSSEDDITGTSEAGSGSITSCYIPSGTTGSNTTGIFTYTGASYYCN